MPSIEKKHRRSRAVESDSDDGANPRGGSSTGGRNDAILAKVDPEYLNRPIDLKQGDAKLKGLIVQLNMMQKQLRDVANGLGDVAGEMAESLSEQHVNDEYDEDALLKLYFDNPSLAGLDGEFRSVLDKIKENEIRVSIISDIRGRIVGGHQISDVYKLYEQKARGPLDEYGAQTPRQKFLSHKQYKEFTEQVWEQLTNGGAVPNVKRFLPREDADEEESDDELEIGAQQQNYTCPLTLEIFVDPYSSTVCPHSFSGDDIKDLIRQNGGSVQCPNSGCPKRLTLANIERDTALNKRVEAHQKRLREGRTQPGTQAGGRTYEAMDLSDEDD
ncbi:hypothetical protein JCM8547_000294 [Rhodosporidiobolus lusitaniae]